MVGSNVVVEVAVVAVVVVVVAVVVVVEEVVDVDVEMEGLVTGKPPVSAQHRTLNVLSGSAALHSGG